MVQKWAIIQTVLGIGCVLLPYGNTMSVVVETPHTNVNPEVSENPYMEKLADLRKTLIDRMKTMANILEYIDAYSKTKSKVGVDTLPGLEEIEATPDAQGPYVSSKVDVWLENTDVARDIPLDVIGSVLDATLHDRFKRSAIPKKKRKGKDDEESEDTSSDDTEDSPKRRKSKSRKGRSRRFRY